MAVQWEPIIRSVVTVVPGLVAIVGLARGPGALRSRLKHDIELLEKLPEGSEPHAVMLDHISAQVHRMTAREDTASRDWPMFVVSVIAAPGLGLMSVYLWQQHHWWGILLASLSGLLAVIFLYGLFETGQRVPRDSRGKRIPAAAESA